MSFHSKHSSVFRYLSENALSERRLRYGTCLTNTIAHHETCTSVGQSLAQGFREGGLFCKAKGKDGMQISADNSLNVGDQISV